MSDVHRYNPDLYKYDDDDGNSNQIDIEEEDHDEDEKESILSVNKVKKTEKGFWLNYIGLIAFVVAILLLALVATDRSGFDALSGQVGNSGLTTGGDLAVDVSLPDILKLNLVDWTPVIWRDYDTATPMFWHMPMSAGNIVESALVGCLGLLMASGAARDTPEIEDSKLSVVSINKHLYVNVDLSSRLGVMRAADLQLIPNAKPDIVSTPHFRLAVGSIFTPSSKARLFTVIRHPLDRVVASYELFIEKQQINPEEEDSWWFSAANATQMTLEEYVDSPHWVSNWMTRFLSGRLYSPVQNEDLLLSISILREKALVGLYDEMDETLHRFERYYDWTRPQKLSEDDRMHIDQCYNHQLINGDYMDYVGKKTPSSYHEGKVQVSDYVKEALKFDLELYKVAQEIFDYQGAALKNADDEVETYDIDTDPDQDNEGLHLNADEIFAFSEIDKPCIVNGDFLANPPTMHWYGVLADLTFVDGLFGNALKAEHRQNQRKGGMWQNIRSDCLEVNRWYVITADYYLEKAATHEKFYCNPAIMEGNSTDSCPAIGLRVGDHKIQDIAWSIGPLYDDTPGKMGWHEMYGAFKVTEDMVKKQLSIFVARASVDSDIILDNVALRPAQHNDVGIRGCNSVIANGDAEIGDYRYWFIKGAAEGGGGEIQLIQPGYGGDGYAFKHTGHRQDRWKGMLQSLDSSCFELGSIWKITAMFRFYRNAMGEEEETPVSCTKGNPYDMESCPVFEVKFSTPTKPIHVTTGPLNNEIDDPIDVGEWNKIEHVFVVDYEMSTFTEVRVHINAVDKHFNYELDNIEMIRING